MPFVPDSPTSGAGYKGRFVPDRDQGESTAPSAGINILKNAGADASDALGSFVMERQAGVGTLMQAPGAALKSGFYGAGAALDRGVTHAMNWVSPGSAEINAGSQRAAQEAAAEADAQRQENINADGGSWLNPRTALARVGLGLQEDARGRAHEIEANRLANNPGLASQMRALSDADGVVDTAKAIVNNPRAMFHALTQSLPDMLMGLGLSRVAAMSVLKNAGTAAEAAAARVAAAGGTQAAQDAAKAAVLDGVTKQAVARASAVGIAAEAAPAAMSARESTYREIKALPPETLATSKRYGELLAGAGGDHERAREALANELADQTPLLVAAGTLGGSVATNKLFRGDATARAVAGVERQTLKGVGRNTVQEGTEEVLQGIPEDLTRYGAGVQADEGKKLDLGGGAVQNFAAGAIMGAGGTGGRYAHQTYRDLRGGAQADGRAGTLPGAPAAATGDAPIAAADVLGSIEAAAVDEPTPAEKALREVRPITALDRVNKIDEALNAAPDSPDAAALVQERAALTANWPKMAVGADTSFSTEAGARIAGRYALIEASDLQASHDTHRRVNPAYPAELQPRDRTRAASAAQIAGISSKLDPAKLGLSADAATGAPIIGEDGLVESGNARTIALQTIYSVPGQKAEEYKAWLGSNAGTFGLTAEAVQGMSKPVLVRVRTTPVDRAEFARQANASTVAAMSPVEQARADSARIDSMEDLSPDEQGDFVTSRDFISRFVGRLPKTEQSGMIDAGGQLSSSGYARVRNAVLAKAYGDSPVLTRMVESMDDNLRNVSRALMIAAPRVAQARGAMADGRLFDADITPHLVSAVEELGRLKDSGTSVHDALAQAGLLGDQYTPETRELLGFLADNLRRPRRMAEFVTSYFDALEAMGDPAQGSLLGEVTAPTTGELMSSTRRTIEPTTQGEPNASATQDAKRGDPGEAAPGRAGVSGEPPAAPGGGGRNQGDEGASAAVGPDWVAFDAASGTLGIPRADMPQVAMKHRGALVQFLQGRGIGHEVVDVDPATLKPTQAEFSISRTERAKTIAADSDTATALISSDNYVLDGHHRWLGQAAKSEQLRVIRFDSPINDLLAAVRAFPSATTSGHSAKSKVVSERDAARAEFMDSLGALGAFLTRHQRMAMVPEDLPGLMPHLKDLAGKAIVMVGTDLRAVVRWVREVLKADPKHRSVHAKVPTSLIRKAAEQAMAEIERSGAQAGLFDQAELQAMAQGDLFASQPTTAPKVAMIDGRPYEAKRDNFKLMGVATFMDAGVLERADGYVQRYYKDRPPVVISDEERARAEGLLTPLMSKAKDVKAEYDQKVIDIVGRTNAIGQMIAPIKGMARSVEKLVKEENFDVGGMKDVLRSTIVVGSYSDAQRVLDEIEKEFKLLRKPKNRTSEVAMTWSGGKLPAEDRQKFGGYADVLVNVTMPNGVIAEIQINVPQTLAAKEGQGHKLYEAQREAPKDSPLGREIGQAMTEFYDAAFAAAAAKKPVESPLSDMPPAGSSRAGASDAPSSDSLNTPPSGNSTNQSPPNVGTKRLPGGNLSGSFISTSSGILPRAAGSAYTSKPQGENDVTADQDNRAGHEGAGAKPAPRADGAGPVGDVPARPRGRDQRPGGGLDDGTADEPGLGQAGPDAAGNGGPAERGKKLRHGGRARAGAGVPAGRDIRPKSGLNYRFTDADITPPGSWAKRAEWNVEAVELIARLRAEKRQATAAEQRTLARFVGWGASEIASNLFGKKLDEQAAALQAYDEAIVNLASRPYITNANYSTYNPAFKVLKAKSPELNWYTAGNITKAMLDAAKPPPAVKRWIELRDRLRAALTADEWKEAARSTQYGHYTSGGIVRGMWRALDRFGFKGGLVLEPGGGKGTFPGLMPEAMLTNSSYTGIEYDSITGAILGQLFPDERILVESFVDSKLPKDFYDVGIGNPPFSGTKVLSDPEYAQRAFALHDYFFAKTLDRVRPGGALMFVTSRFTMDKKGDKARQYLAERADLVGAIRLPQTAFKDNAGTDVVTDVLFLRKRAPGAPFEHGQAWMNAVEVQTKDGPAFVNEYFAAHPEMILGTPALAGSMYRDNEYTVLAPEGDIEALFSQAVDKMPSDILTAPHGSAAEAAAVRELDFNPKAKKEGNYYLSDAGVLMQREGGTGFAVQLKSKGDAEIIKAFVPLRDALKQAQHDQLNDGDWQASLAALQAAYKTFTAKHGAINQSVMKARKVKVDELDADGEPTGRKVDEVEERRVFQLLRVLTGDPEATLVSSLENVNEETGEVSPGDFLTKRALGARAAPQIDTPHDALMTVLNDTGKVSIGAIATRMDIAESDAIEALGSAVYQNPEGEWETADDYLSGNVKRKLEVAQAAAKSDRRYERNVEALKAAQPAPKNPADINVGIGMNWIPGEVYEQFLLEKTGIQSHVRWNAATKQWVVQFPAGVSKNNVRAMSDWGTSARHAGDILENALTGRPLRVTKEDGSGKDKKTVFDPDATEAANQKLEAMKAAFSTWVWQDAQRTDSLVPIFNDKFNTTVAREHDGRHLTLPGTSALFNVFDHVKRGASRIIQSGNTYLAHAVGSGKTFQMVISAMEQKRLGFIKKPMVVVPNHMLQQFAREWQQLYPAARLMVADEENFHTDNRRRFVSRVSLSDLDGVIITHSAFKMLDVDPDFKSKIIDEQLEFLRASLEEAKDDEGETKGKRSPRVKQIEKQIENLEEKLKATMSGAGKDKNIRFDELGVDFLYVDEAHAYRKLDFATSRQVKGLSPAGSARALDLYVKARYLESKTPGRSLVLASGTPITNTVAEIYTVQKFLGRQAMIDRGIEDFDSWAAMFGRESTTLEANAGGKYEPVTRFNRFVNLPEMTQMFREFADVLTSDNLAALLGDKRPKVEGGGRQIVVTPKTAEYAEYQKTLAQRFEDSKKWKPSKDEPNNPDPVIVIIGDGRLAAIDMRFVSPSQPSDPDSKLNRMISDVIRVFKETADMQYHDKAGKVEKALGATMMVFSDIGMGAGVAANRGFNARAWFEKRMRDAGVPMSQVAFMSDYKKSTDKFKLFSDVNAGRVRVLVGSTMNMGTGVNAQQRLLTMFHLDAPWFPADLEQREGRAVRQGNKNKIVRLRAYAAKGSYDEQMWATLAKKQFFIDQALSGDPLLREIEDVGAVGMLEQAAGMVAEDQRILQLAGLRADIEKMNRLYRAHEDQRARFRQEFRSAELEAEYSRNMLPKTQEVAAQVQDLSGDKFTATVGRKAYNDRGDWGDAVKAAAKALAAAVQPSQTMGDVSGFKVRFWAVKTDSSYQWDVRLDTPVQTALLRTLEDSSVGMAIRATNAVSDVARTPARLREGIAQAEARMDALRPRLQAAFPMLEMLAAKQREASALEHQIATQPLDKDPPEFDADTSAAGAALGMIPPEWQGRLSRGHGGGISIRGLQGVADKIALRLPGLPRVTVLRSTADAPEKLQDFMRARGAMADAEGAFFEGRIYLFSSGIADETRAEHVLAEHEAAHAGLAGILGADLRQTMQALFNNNASLRRAAAPLIARGLSTAEAVEEVIVDIPSGELARLKGWRAFVAKVRDALDARGFTRFADYLGRLLDGHLTDQQRADLQVADLVREARAFRAKGRTPETTAGHAPRLSTAQAAGAPQQAPQAAAVPTKPTAEERANALIQTRAATAQPLDAAARVLTRITGLDRLTLMTHGIGAKLIDWITPERVKAGIVSDYGVPEAVIDQRAVMQGTQREQLRQVGKLIEKLTTLTRAESRVAYEWMNMDGSDPRAYVSMMQGLPEESVLVLQEVQTLIDSLSKEAVRLGQLDPEAFKRNRFAYLRRSYFKHALELTGQEKAGRSRAISILGDQYKGRGMVEKVPMKAVQNVAPAWWGRKVVDGKADTSLKGEKFERLERHAPSTQLTAPLEGVEGNMQRGKLLETHYWPAGEPKPAKYADWDSAGTWEVRNTSGGDLVMWRDFTKEEREKMGEIDEARYAIGKTLHAMIHDVEVGRYLEWLAQNHAKKPGETFTGAVVGAADGDRGPSYAATFKPGEWVQVPETKITGTGVLKYGKLGGLYLPGPIWNDLRQVVAGRAAPFGQTYADILRMWKISKTALSPAVHTNNVMSNMVMADWHDVTAGHVAKALRIVLAAKTGEGKGALGRAGNVLGRAGIADKEAAQEVLTRYENSGGAIGGWVTQEIANEQLEPIVAALQKELAATAAATAPAEIGIYSALQHALGKRFPQALEAFKASRPASMISTDAKNLMALYQAEDDVFRLAAWLKAKEEGASDADAGKLARRSFLDYSINAPWIAFARATALPFISFTYRAVPMLIETAAKRPHKLFKLMALAGGLNYLFGLLAGGGDDDEEARLRKMLPDEKAGGVWGMVPKLIRMPWHDSHGSPVFLDIRRWIPVGDVLDLGQGHAALPIPPALMPGGPLAVLGELIANRSLFTDKAIKLETDTAAEHVTKLVDHLWKAAMPNILGVPGTYATTGVGDAIGGRTDAFGRELSVPQAVLSSFGVKVGSYPLEVARRNVMAKLHAQIAEIDKQIGDVKRQRMTHRISQDEFVAETRRQEDKKRALTREAQDKMN